MGENIILSGRPKSSQAPTTMLAMKEDSIAKCKVNARERSKKIW